MCAFCNRYFYYFKTFFSVFRSSAVTYVHRFTRTGGCRKIPSDRPPGCFCDACGRSRIRRGRRMRLFLIFFFPLLYIIHLFRRIGSRSWAKNAFKGVFGFSGRFGFPARPFCTENAANSGCLRPKSANSLFGGLSERSSVRRPVPGQNRPRFPMQKARKYRHAPIRRMAAMEGSGPGGAGGRDATVQGVDS